MIFNAYSESSGGLFGISIKSAGHIFAEQGRRVSRPNGRDDWLLFYVAKGCERFTINGEIDAAEGSFIIFKPRERQEHVTVFEGTSEFYYVHFTAPEGFSPLDLNTYTVYPSKPSTRVRDAFEDIIGELQTKRTSYESLCVSRLFDILAWLSRRTADMTSPLHRYSDKITYVIGQMNREYYEDRTLDDYAEICKMSKFHFLRVFKEITGVSPLEYRNKIRIDHAKELLEDDSIPVGEVGALVGYASASYFCDAFKKRTGYSPIQYRQLIKKS